jgi:hypothetical protein
LNVVAEAGARPVVVETSRTAADARLRSRVHDIPFEDVWQAALALASGDLRGWTLISANDQQGIIRAEGRTFPFRAIDDVTIRVVLDDDARTWVDASSAARAPGRDFGRNGKRVAKFFAALEDLLVRRPQRAPLYRMPEGR